MILKYKPWSLSRLTPPPVPELYNVIIQRWGGMDRLQGRSWNEILVFNVNKRKRPILVFLLVCLFFVFFSISDFIFTCTNIKNNDVINIKEEPLENKWSIFPYKSSFIFSMLTLMPPFFSWLICTFSNCFGFQYGNWQLWQLQASPFLSLILFILIASSKHCNKILLQSTFVILPSFHQSRERFSKWLFKKNTDRISVNIPLFFCLFVF